MVSQPSFSSDHSFDVPNDISKLCDSNIDMGNEDNVLNMLGGNVDTFMSLGNFSGYDAALDPHCINLVDKPRKIMWNTFFDFSFDFSLVFTLLKRALTLFSVFIFVLSHSQVWKPFVEEFDRRLHALTMLAQNSQVLTRGAQSRLTGKTVNRKPVNPFFGSGKVLTVNRTEIFG